MLKNISLIGCLSLFLFLSQIIPQQATAQSLGSEVTNLTKWQFSKNNANDWTWVTVPHSCNAVDGHSASYYRGKAYYKIPLSFQKEQLQKPLFLLFCGAAQAAEVYVNGKSLTYHKGGYTPFVVSLRGSVKEGENEVMVVCDNKEDVDLIPVSSDFNKNNGLHNFVYLLEMNDVYASPYTYGFYRMHVSTPQVSDAEAATQVETTIHNASDKKQTLQVALSLTDQKGKVVFLKKEKMEIPSGDSVRYARHFTITKPHLWNGMTDPYLYKAKIVISDLSGRVFDKVETKVGYRFYRMDAEKGFFLNGHSYPLRGVSMHQDWNLKASALDKTDMNKDYDIIKEIGANFLRLAHYPHNDYEFQLCDELGIIVQTEIPWVNVCGIRATKEYFNNIHQQMREMITNLYNHPSIVFWGMWNELERWGNNDKLQGAVDYSRIVSETARLYQYAKSLDPYRFVGLTDCSSFKREGYEKLKGDYYSENRYAGWYVGKYDDFSADIQDIHHRMGITNVSEYGCGINPFCHTYDSLKINNSDFKRHFEEYGDLVHEAHVRQIMHMPYLNFTSLWILFDFPVASRMEGYMDSDDGVHFIENNVRKYTNDKGLVTRDRKVKKDVFYLYKSWWNKKQTTVYITGRRLTQHHADLPFVIKVYSNAKSLTLYQNGAKLQTLKNSGEETGLIWRFKPVTLKTADDTFSVVASDGTQDKVQFQRF